MSILINIASEFTGKKAFNSAEKSVNSLQKSVKSLGNSIGLALSTTAIIAYGKASVKAFADDEAAARRLATAVDNLGLSYFSADVETFIANTEKSAAILDDKLRPAFQALLTTTGSLTQSQKLLNNAIQISRASGEDLSVVAQDLANGYVGITKGLKKYNTGLTQAELKTKSFSEILGVLLSRSAGAADSYLGTTAYQMEVLTVAAANAHETIGKGLVDAFARLGGGSSAQDAANNIQSIANAIADVTRAVGTFVGLGAKAYKFINFVTSLGGLTGSNGKIAEQFNKASDAEKKRLEILRHSARSSSPAGSWARTKQQREAEAAAAKRAKELAALTKKQVAAQKSLTAEQKKQASLKKSAGIFDMEQIQIIAALKGKLTDDEKLRLQLQLAIIQGNDKVAAELATKLAESQYRTENLAILLKDLPKPLNPFADWITNLDEIEARLRRIAATPMPTPTTNVPSSNNFVFPDPAASIPEVNRERGNFYGSNNGGVQNVTVQIDGKTIADALLDQAMSGNNAYLNRRIGGFD